MMLGSNFVWETPHPLPDPVRDELGSFSEPLQSVLYSRGVSSNQEAIDFLLPREPGWSADILPRGAVHSAELIKSALNKNQRITVYGDYDADGITATALVINALRRLGADANAYIPSRHTEGYGLNQAAIKTLASQGTSLLITVDNGIKSFAEVEFANNLGLTVIISDHHTPESAVPAAAAVINPKQADDPYPNKALAGVGVAYKLISALSESFPDLDPAEYLDLVAIGTVADIVPLTGENRYLVRQGLSKINRDPGPGVRALVGISGLSGRAVLASDISFQIAPRINSSSRLDHGSTDIPLNLFLSSDSEECGRLAQRLENDNDRRKALSRKIEKRLDRQFEALPEPPPIISHFHSSIPQGIAGIAAGYLARKFNRPAIVGTIHEEETIASCRSIPNFNIIQALDAVSDLLIRHGGHAQAAGFTILNSNRSSLTAELEDYASVRLEGKDLRPRLRIDAAVPLKILDYPLYKELQKLEPTGESNPLPVLTAHGLTARKKSTIGKNNDHLKLIVSDGVHSLEAIGFGLGHMLTELPPKFDLAFNLALNEFRGKRHFQLQVIDIKPSI